MPGRPGYVWLEARYLPWRDRSGEMAGVVGVHTDVSERRRSATFVRAVEAVGQSLASSLDLNEVLDTIVGKALEVMAAESAMVVSWDGQAPHAHRHARGGAAQPRIRRRRLAAASAVDRSAASILQNSAGVDIRHPDRSARRGWSRARRAQIEREGFKAVAAAPLRSKGRVHGALIVHYWAERSFADEEIGALRWLAEQAALAIDNARVYADATRRAEQPARAGRGRAAGRRVARASTTCCAASRRPPPACSTRRSCSCGPPTPGSARCVCKPPTSEPGSVPVPLPPVVAFGEGVAGRVADAKQPIYVDDVSQDSRALSAEWARETGIQRMLSVPILTGDDLLGVLSVRSRTDELATDENRALVISLAGRAALALQNARAYDDAVRRAARLRDLVAVSRSITASLDAGDVMTRIAQAAGGMRPGALAAVHVFDEDRTTAARRRAVGPRVGGSAARAPGRRRPARSRRRASRAGAGARSRATTRARSRPRGGSAGRARRTTVCPIDVGETFVGVLDYVLPEGAARRRGAGSAAAAGRAGRRRHPQRRASTRPSACRPSASARWSPSTSASRARSSWTMLLRTISESAASSPACASASFWLADEAAPHADVHGRLGRGDGRRLPAAH